MNASLNAAKPGVPRTSTRAPWNSTVTTAASPDLEGSAAAGSADSDTTGTNDLRAIQPSRIGVFRKPLVGRWHQRREFGAGQGARGNRTDVASGLSFIDQLEIGSRKVVTLVQQWRAIGLGAGRGETVAKIELSRMSRVSEPIECHGGGRYHAVGNRAHAGPASCSNDELCGRAKIGIWHRRTAGRVRSDLRGQPGLQKS